MSLLLLSCRSSKETASRANTPNYDVAFVDELFKDYSGENPGASIIIVRDGAIELAKSYGYADLDRKILATPASNYRIASVSKQFTAFAIMLLVHRGKLTYQTKLKTIFPAFPAYGAHITIQHLLTHRAGLVKYTRFLTAGQKEQMLDRDVLNGLLETDSTYFQPGTQYAYSNTGYAILAQVVEKISGVSFSDFIQKEVFAPLDMTTSTIFESGKTIKHRAYGYLVRQEGVTAKDQSLTSAIQGDGCIYTSVVDYFKWDQALYTNELLPQSVLDEAFYGYDENGKTEADGYGYGWEVSYYKGTKILQHGGSTTGFGSHVIRVPSEKIMVAIFTNRNKRGKELAHRAKALLSHFSHGKFQMPFEIILEKEIDEHGIAHGIKQLDRMKRDTQNYSVSAHSLFMFAIDYLNNHQNTVALQLFEQLIQDDPSYFGGYYGKAAAHKALGDKALAIKYFSTSIAYCSAKEQWAIDYCKKMIAELEE